MKVAELEVYNRVVHGIKANLHAAQYSYRRDTGTDMHIAALTAFATEQLEERRYLYPASLDIGGAFDVVPHEVPIGSLWATQANGRCARFIESWARYRSFRVRQTTQIGRFHSLRRTIAQGLPQGGVLSQFSWGLLFNCISDVILTAFHGCECMKYHGVQTKILLCEDDIAVLTAHDDPAVLKQAAHYMKLGTY